MKHSTLTPSHLAALLCAGAMGFAVQAHALDINATNYWTVDAVEKPLFSRIGGVKNGVEFSTPFSFPVLQPVSRSGKLPLGLESLLRAGANAGHLALAG